VGQLPERIRTGRYCFDVLETPGHCRGHVALVEPAMGWCFSGDLLVSTEPRVIRPEENVWETIASMKRILALDSDGLVLFCGAFGKVFQDGLGALRSCVDYLEDLARKVAQLKGRGFSAPKMRDALLGRESSLAELSGGDASSLNLVRALMREEAAA
jgi:glyoxylase-like metal-dependent hydrolase (beta-lactamase superfamily II)